MILSVFKSAKHTKACFATVATIMGLMLLQNVVAASAKREVYRYSRLLEFDLFVNLFGVVVAVIAVVEKGAFCALCVAAIVAGYVVDCGVTVSAVLLGMINCLIQLNLKITLLTGV